jgi:hypothetical protein
VEGGGVGVALFVVREESTHKIAVVLDVLANKKTWNTGEYKTSKEINKTKEEIVDLMRGSTSCSESATPATRSGKEEYWVRKGASCSGER